MIRVGPFATALAATSAICYVLTVLLAVVLPGVYISLMQAWALMDVARLGAPLVTLPLFVVGLVSLMVGGWLFGAFWAIFYNWLAASHVEPA